MSEPLTFTDEEWNSIFAYGTHNTVSKRTRNNRHATGEVTVNYIEDLRRRQKFNDVLLPTYEVDCRMKCKFRTHQCDGYDGKYAVYQVWKQPAITGVLKYIPNKSNETFWCYELHSSKKVITMKHITTELNQNRLILVTIEKVLVNSAIGFLQLWSTPARRKWLVQSKSHPLARHKYNFINSPLGDPDIANAYRSGQQCFVGQQNVHPELGKCPNLTLINKACIYEKIGDNNTNWIRILKIFPTVKSRPVMIVFYQNIEHLENNNFIINLKQQTIRQDKLIITKLSFICVTIVRVNQ